MKLLVDDLGTTESLKNTLTQALQDGPVGCLLVLSSDANGYTPANLDPILRTVPVPILGGLFPAVYCRGRQLKRGSVVVAMKRRAEVFCVSGLSQPDMDFEQALEHVAQDWEFKTLLIFPDGLSTRIGAFVEALYTTFGLEVNYVGAGVGSLPLSQRPGVITNDGLKQDVAVLAALDLESGVGVRHGWTSISGPHQVTEAGLNCIMELDWRPALDVFREVVEKHSGRKFDDLDFRSLLMAYPYGVSKLGAEMVVGDFIGRGPRNSLVCLGNIPFGTYVNILHGDPDDLVAAATQAKLIAQAAFPGEGEPGLNLFIDCVSRQLRLKDDFQREVDAVMSSSQNCVGICSVGEIANNGRDYLEFYNKTSVVAYLEDD